MNKLDLIIDALDVSESLFYDQTKLQEALLAARELKALEPVAHMYPSTLKDFEHGEKADYAFSIEMGNMKTGEETVPLYALDLEVTK
jgi:hypothetical protein